MSIINKIKINADARDIGVDWSNVANPPTSMPASDVYDWAKASSKPSYSWDEITSKPDTFTPSSHVHDDRYYTETEVSNLLANKANSSHGTHVSGTASFTSGSSGDGRNANDITSNAIVYYTSNGPSTEIGASTSDGALYCQAYSDSWVGQIAQDYRDGDLFVRGKNNGTWQAWKKVWVSGDSINAPSIQINSKVTLQYNTSTESLDFIFA